MSAIEKALSIIKKYEGCVLHAYPDPASGGDPWTIGWGNTQYHDGTPVKKGDKITQEHADALLYHWVMLFMKSVKGFVKSDINDNQLAALTSFAYNCGLAALRRSTLLKKVNKNPMDPEIGKEFQKWVKASGKVFNGLVRRRIAEYQLYATPKI